MLAFIGVSTDAIHNGSRSVRKAQPPGRESLADIRSAGSWMWVVYMKRLLAVIGLVWVCSTNSVAGQVRAPLILNEQDALHAACTYLLSHGYALCAKSEFAWATHCRAVLKGGAWEITNKDVKAPFAGPCTGPMIISIRASDGRASVLYF